MAPALANPAIDAIHTQLKEITSSIKNYQKFIEQNDHTDRTKPDRKYNIVVYGIEECPSGTPISERNRHDINETLSIFSKLDSAIQHFPIKDSLCLGKYKNDSQRPPRPVLVKMNRLMDASSILSKRSDLPNGIFVKPDMTPEEQCTEASLLKERWLLMQKGINKNDIKLSLYVQGKKYTEVTCTNSNLIKKIYPCFSHSN